MYCKVRHVARRGIVEMGHVGGNLNPFVASDIKKVKGRNICIIFEHLLGCLFIFSIERNCGLFSNSDTYLTTLFKFLDLINYSKGIFNIS